MLAGQLSQAARLVPDIHAQHFHLYVTQDLEAAKRYVQERYRTDLDKRYGLFASSRATNLKRYGIDNDYQTARNIRIGPWYNDPPTSPYSCCQLNTVVREFDCQGLEVDFPIVTWGNDLTWYQTQWKSMPMPRSKARDPHRLQLNSYRVLLSRGRDGLIIFVPPETSMHTTYEALIQAGVYPL